MHGKSTGTRELSQLFGVGPGTCGLRSSSARLAVRRLFAPSVLTVSPAVCPGVLTAESRSGNSLRGKLPILNHEFAMKPDPRILLALLAFLGISSCGDLLGGSSGAPPVIAHLGVEFGRYDPGTGMAGDFSFHGFPASGGIGTSAKLFLEFGGSYYPGPDCPPDCGTASHMIFRLPPEARVYAPADAVVEAIRFDENWQDFEITLRPSRQRTRWFLNIDHLLDVRVARGQWVRAGDWIAVAGNHHVEIDLNSDNGYSYCIFDYFDAAARDEWRQRVLDFMNDWEAYLDDPTIYDQGAMVEPGCAVKIIQH